jgi:formamidopyrimidine-DNA glycosylase
MSCISRIKLMITILAIAITWYLTKIYYTKTLKVSIYDLEQHDLVQARCNKCAQTIVTHIDNLRSPFYCLACK